MAETNKEAFDFMYSHKNEIEQALAIPLQWERLNDSKAAYIACELDGVSIANEEDWTRMAKFHAEWSKKFADVLLPILQKKFPNVEVPE